MFGRGVSPLVARLFIFVVCIMMSRVVIKVAAVGLMSDLWPNDQMDDVAALLDVQLPWQEPATGDGPRRGDMPEDLDREGQVVRRNGELVILVDDSDPENEVYVPLNSAESAVALNPLLQIDPMWLSVGMGSFLFVGLMFGSWWLNQDDDDDDLDKVAPTTPDTTRNPPTMPDIDGNSW